MAAAAAQLRHTLRVLAVFGAILSEFTVWLDRAGTTRVGALLRLIHEASAGDVPGNCRTGRSLLLSGSGCWVQVPGCRVPGSGLPSSGSWFQVQIQVQVPGSRFRFCVPNPERRAEPGTLEPNNPEPEPGTRTRTQTRNVEPGTLRLKVWLCAVGLRPGVQLALGTQDAAPVLVLGYRHPALDADAHPLARFGVTRKEPLQKGHEFSRISFYLRRKKGSEGLLNRQKTTDWVKFESGGRRIICDSSAWDGRVPGARDRRFSVWP